MNNPEFSIVIAVYNEESSVKPLYQSLKDVMNKMGRHYEVIFVNDYSSDDTLRELTTLSLESENPIIVSLNKRYGQSLAIQSGLDIAQGEFIITMDGDLQNDPKDIPLLVEKMQDGYDMVCGWRYHRKDPLNRLVASKFANCFRRIITGEKTHDFGCSLKVFRKEALKGVYLSSGMHRFLSLIMLKLGYKVGEIKVTHHCRSFGKSKYNMFNRLPECLWGFTRVLLMGIPKAGGEKNNYRIHRIIRIS